MSVQMQPQISPVPCVHETDPRMSVKTFFSFSSPNFTSTVLISTITHKIPVWSPCRHYHTTQVTSAVDLSRWNRLWCAGERPSCIRSFLAWTVIWADTAWGWCPWGWYDLSNITFTQCSHPHCGTQPPTPHYAAAKTIVNTATTLQLRL